MVVSSLLLAFTYIQSINVAEYFDQANRKVYRLMNYYNAYNCIDQAVLKLAQDYFFEISGPLIISDLNCSIDLVERRNDEIHIETSGIYKSINVKRSAKVKISDDKVQIISTK